MKHWRLVLLFSLLLMLVTGMSQAQSAVTISLSSMALDVGQTGTLNATIDCSGGCSQFAAVISFDPALVRVDGSILGSYLGQQVFLGENVVDNRTGQIRLSASVLGTPPADAENVLFTLNLTGLAPGTAILHFESLTVNDLSGASISALSVDATITVGGDQEALTAFTSHPDWELAFTSERDGNPEIYAMNVTGLNVRRLTDSPTNDHFPVWSPDGSRIVFMSDRDGNDEVYLMNADGSGQTRLTDNPTFDGYASWSQNGTEITFTSARDGNLEIYVMNVDGTNVRRLTTDASNDTVPAWSPSGSEIMFVSNRAGTDELYLMNADGSNVRRMSNLFGANGWYPAWKPNAQDVAFLVGRDSLMGDIYVMNASDNQAIRLGDLTEISSHMDWSVDGEWLAFVSLRDGNPEIYVMDANGQNPMRLTDDLAEDYEPDWRTVATATTSTEECIVRAQTANVIVRVGPGTQRGSYTFMPLEDEIRVVGQAVDQSGETWWSLDKVEFSGSENVNSLWVSSDEVLSTPSCANVPIAEAPPVVQAQPAHVTHGWGACGSCDSCGHSANECVESPEGACLWDPSTCLPSSESGGQPDAGCYQLSLSWGEGGSAAYAPPTTCQNNRSYTPGTTVRIVARTQPGHFVLSWSGTCPGLVSGQLPEQTVTMTSNCSVHVYFTEPFE